MLVGMGCGEQTQAAVDKILFSMKSKIMTRGDTAQIQKTDMLLQEVIWQNSKLDLLLQNQGIAIPVKPLLHNSSSITTPLMSNS